MLAGYVHVGRRTMMRYVALWLIAVVVFGCTSVADRQQRLVSEYIRATPVTDSKIREAIESGKVIPGMTLEQVLIASGEKARGFRSYSIWVVRENGTLALPPTVIAPGTWTALIFRNNTQFNTVTAEQFTVYLDGENRVLRVEQGNASLR